MNFPIDPHSRAALVRGASIAGALRVASLRVALLFLFAAASVPGGAAAGSSSSEPRTLDAWVAAVRDGEANRGEAWSVCAMDADTGRIVFEYDSRERLIPASNRKIAVFGLALEKLGPEFRFRTELGLTRSHGFKDGVLTATAVLRSNGDPTMRDRYLGGANPATVIREWIRKLRDEGVRRLQGDFVIDASGFGPEQDVHPAAWGEDHFGYSYAPYPSAIALNENLIRVTVSPGGQGSRGKVSLYPTMGNLSIANQTTSVSGTTRGLDARFCEVAGELRVGGRVGTKISSHQVSVPATRPLELVKAVVEDELKSCGIEVAGNVVIATDPQFGARLKIERTIGFHESPPLLELLTVMMRDSDNFVAEQVWRATSLRVTGRGDVDAARALERSWYVSKSVHGIEPGWDGSGLSRKTRISAAEQVAMLEAMRRSAYRSYVLGAMPASGKSGTLRGRTMGAAPGRILAKTGTLSGAAALSGYALDESGREKLVFAAFGNCDSNTNGRLKSRIDQIMKILLKTMDSGPEDGDSRLQIADGSGGKLKKRAPGTKVHAEGSL